MSDRCYFVLKGAVEVKVPRLEEIVIHEHKEFISFLTANFKDIIWEKTVNGDKLRVEAEKHLIGETED